MNHKKIQKQINKVNSFFKSITDDDEISNIEKDLLLSYVRKLYETILDHDDKVEKLRKPIKQSKAPKPEKQEAPPSASARKPFERAETTQKVEEVKSAPEQIVQEVVTVEAEAAVVKVPIANVVETKKIVLSENMVAIFEKTGGNEISDKLGNLPIKDLTKAMGINERMFTIKELFGGNQDRFKDVMSHINKLDGYDDAKEYLLNGVAAELNWDSEENYKKADKFVKLVQRRFS